MPTPSSYAWDYTLQNAVPVASAVTVLTPGFANPDEYDVAGAQVTHGGKVLQPTEFTLNWAGDFSSVDVTNNSARDWMPQSHVAVAVSGIADAGVGGGAYLPLAGGKLTGPLTIENVAGTPFKVVPPGGLYYPSIYTNTTSPTGVVEIKGCPDSAKASAYFALIGQMPTNQGWKIFMPNADTRSGGDTGANFEIHAVNDAGSDMPSALKIERKTSIITIKVPTDALDDAAAATAGVPVGGLYRNGSVLMVRVA